MARTCYRTHPNGPTIPKTHLRRLQQLTAPYALASVAANQCDVRRALRGLPLRPLMRLKDFDCSRLHQSTPPPRQPSAPILQPTAHSCTSIAYEPPPARHTL